MPQDSESAIVSLTSLQNWIISWARLPEVHYTQVLSMPFSEWLPIWFKNNSVLQNGLFFAAIISLIFSFILWQKKQFSNRWFYLSLICGASVVFWLLTAPSFRFAYGFLWLLALLPILSVNLSKLSPQYLSSFLSLILIVLLTLSHRPALKVIFQKRLFSLENLVIPHTIPNFPIVEKDCINFKIKIPIGNDNCGCNAVPCTPYYQSNIEMRGTDLSSGFRIKK